MGTDLCLDRRWVGAAEEAKLLGRNADLRDKRRHAQEVDSCAPSFSARGGDAGSKGSDG